MSVGEVGLGHAGQLVHPAVPVTVADDGQALPLQCRYHLAHEADRAVSVEWIIGENPDVYVARLSASNPTGGYGSDEGTDYQAYYDEIMGLTGFEYINAVKDNRVHIITGHITYRVAIPIGIAYQATWYHPEVFADLDPQELHQEFIDRFCPGLDFDVSEHGVFVYPPEE